jgi:ABC-2 type transport system ATP-binding protein
MIKSKKEKYWSKYAYSYDEAVDYVVGKVINQAIIERLSKEHLGEVIEYGCGAGYFTKAIAKNAKHVVATDLSDEMLESARIQLKEFKNITFQKADCENSPFPSGKFDCVFIANVLHVIKNPSNALQESYRVLKTEGLLLAVDYTGYSMKLFEKLKLVIRYLKQWGIPPLHGQGNLSPDKLVSLVGNVGFKVDDIQLIGDKIKALYLQCRKK